MPRPGQGKGLAPAVDRLLQEIDEYPDLPWWVRYRAEEVRQVLAEHRAKETAKVNRHRRLMRDVRDLGDFRNG